jgi:hypothetical protein
MFGFPFEYKIAGITVVLVIAVYLLKLLTSKKPGPKRQTISIPPPRRKNRPKVPVNEMTPEELVDETVIIVEEVRDAIMWARSPDRNPGEGNSRPVPKNIKSEDGPIKARRNHIWAVIARLKVRDELFIEMHETTRRFREVFGEQLARPLDVIVNTKNQIIARTEALLQLDYAVRGDPRKEPNKRRPLEVAAGLRLREDGIDPIAQRIEEALIPLRALQKTLRQRKTRPSLL